MDKLLLWIPTLANVSWVAKPTAFPKVDWVSIPFKKETPVATFWSTWTTKKTFPLDKNVINQRWREMTPSKTDDPIVSYLNNNAPEWFMVDLPKAEKILRFVKQENPDLQWEDVVKKAVEYLPSIQQYDMEKNQPQQPAPKQQLPMQWGIRRWTAGMNSLEWTMLEWLEPINKTADKFNPIWQFTQFIDDTVQKIPTISRESMAKALNWTPFEWMEVLPTMVANAPWSLLKTATATARGITNPFDTIVWLSKLVMTPEWRQAVIDRYGSVEWLKQSLTEDPVGMASDALTLLQWWAWLAWKWARIAGFADEASRLSNISNVAWSAADLGLSTAIPKWLQKVTQLWDNLWQKGLLWQAGNTVVKWLVSWTQPLKTAKDAYWVVQEAKPIEYITRKILWATDDQSKLFKAQEARTWQLNKSIDWKNLRKQSDMANEEIVRYWYKPTDTATRAEAHANTMQKIWDNEIKARIGNEFDIDLNNVADKIDEFVAKQTDAGLVKNKAQLAELQAQSKAFREMWTVDGAKWEFIKEMINAQINNWGDSSIWDVYKNGMKEATRQLWVNLDEAFSRIPWEFADAKKRFWALKATYADVVKADIKAQKAKWAWLAETFSRIEWFWDLASWIFWMFTGKNPIPQVASWLWKLAVWKVLQKLKDKDFLIQEWFEWLSKKAGQITPVIKAETNRKALPLMEWAMEFQSPTARIGNTQPRWVDITETGMENVRQPQTTKTDPLVKSIAQEPKKPIVKADTPTISPKAKKPLIKAEVASKVDGMKRVVKIDQLKELAKSTDKKTFVREFVDWWKWDQFEPLYVNWVEVDKFMLVPKLDELYNGKFSTIDEAISKFYDDAISKVDDALPVWEKMWNTKQSSKSLDKIDNSSIVEEARKYESVENIKTLPTRDFTWPEMEELSNNIRTEASIERAKGLFSKDWPYKWKTPPVEVTISKDGSFIINDWHHRSMAWYILNQEIPVKVVRNDLKPETLGKYIALQKQWLKKSQIYKSREPWTFDAQVAKKFAQTTPTTTPANWLKPLVKANVSDTSDITSSIKCSRFSWFVYLAFL